MINLYTKGIEDVWFGVAYDAEEIFATTFAFSEKRALHSLLDSIPLEAPFQQLETASTFAERVIAVLKDVYDGKHVSNKLSLCMRHLPDYAKKVIQVTSLIPLGYVTSYGLIAKVAGGSPRAVGRVMALNPFAPIVPCHRVVGSDFSLGGYGGGLDVKREFLKRETRGFTSEHEISINGKKLQLFPVGFVLNKLSKEKKKAS